MRGGPDCLHSKMSLKNHHLHLYKGRVAIHVEGGGGGHEFF